MNTIENLIKNIIIIASSEYKFNINIDTYHPNDAITVCQFYNGEEWQIWLARPTKKELQNDFSDDCLDNNRTFLNYETETYFFTRSHSLEAGLRRLWDELEFTQFDNNNRPIYIKGQINIA